MTTNRKFLPLPWEDALDRMFAARSSPVYMSEYVEMPVNATEDDLRKAVVEVGFMHNVTVESQDVEVDAIERFASWGKCKRWEGLGEEQEDGE